MKRGQVFTRWIVVNGEMVSEQVEWGHWRAPVGHRPLIDEAAGMSSRRLDDEINQTRDQS